MLIPIIWFMSGNIIFRQTHDLSGYCGEQANTPSRTIYLKSGAEENYTTLQAVLDSEDSTVLFLYTLQEANYMGAMSSTSNDVMCHEYTNDEIYHFNYFWVVGFLFLGLQFTHADIDCISNFSLSWHSMLTYTPFEWGLFFLMLGTCGGILYEDFGGLYSCGVLLRYIIFFAVLIGAIVLKTKAEKPYGLELHIHHYFLALVMLFLLGYQSWFISLCHGAGCGVMIEGANRWGFDPMWCLPENGPCEENEAETLKPEARKNHTTEERRRWVSIKKHQSIIRNENEKTFAEAQVDAPQHYFVPQPQQY